MCFGLAGVHVGSADMLVLIVPHHVSPFKVQKLLQGSYSTLQIWDSQQAVVTGAP